MKKVNYSIFFIALLCVLVMHTSCNKSVRPSETSSRATRDGNSVVYNGVTYPITNGILCFNTIENYLDAINTTSISDLTSFCNLAASNPNLASYFEANENNIEVANEVEIVGKFVNDQGFVKIGEFLVKLDFISEKVYTKSEGTTSELNMAAQGQHVSGVVVYDMAEDVLEGLQSRRTRCSEKWAAKKTSGANIETNQQAFAPSNPLDPNDTDGIMLTEFVVVEVKYRKFGIYFDLRSNVLVTPVSPGQGAEPFSYVTTYSCKRRCGNNFSGSSTRNFPNPQTTDVNYMYWNVRALTTYSLSATLTAANSLVPGASVTASIND